MTFPSLIMNSSDIYDDFIEEEDYLSPFFSTSDSWHVLAEASALLILCFTTTTASLSVIMTLTAGKFEVIDLYLLSLCVADLLSSVIVIPLSLTSKSGLVTEGGGHFACAVSGYLHASLCAVRMYTLMWVAVDRYLAMRKPPQRYDSIQTRTRCQCWILFSWIMATCLCCPPLLGDSRGHFYHEGFLCLLDISSMLPYSITIGCLVLIPSILTLLYTYSYIFTTTKSADATKEDYDHNSSYHITTFLVTVEFVLLRMPWGVISIFELTSGRSLAGPITRFWMLLLGESYIAWTPLTILIMCGRCNAGLTAICIKSSTEILV